MSKSNEPITLEGFTNKKTFSFMGCFLLGIIVAFLAQAFIPYVKATPIMMFIIFPVISLPLCLYILVQHPKCRTCGGKTKPAPTPAKAKYDNLKCVSCGQRHKIHSMTRN